MRWLAGLFLIAHGLIHVAIWVPPPQKGGPFDVHHSPMFGEIRRVTVVLAALAGSVFVLSGVGYLADQDWWAPGALAASAVSVVLMVLTFTPWWLVALAINAAIAVLAWRAIQG